MLNTNKKLVYSKNLNIIGKHIVESYNKKMTGNLIYITISLGLVHMIKQFNSKTES